MIPMITRPAKVLLSGCTYDTATLSHPSAYSVMPETDTDSGLAVLHCEGANRATIRFCGTDSDGETFSYAIYGLVRVVQGGRKCFLPEKVDEQATAVLGATQPGAAATFIEASTFLVDTLGEPQAKHATAVVRTDTNALGSVIIDCTDYEAIVILVTTNSKTAESVTVLGQVNLAPTAVMGQPDI